MANCRGKTQHRGFRQPQGMSVGLFEQQPTPVTPSAGLLNFRKERCDVKAENPGVKASRMAASGDRGSHSGVVWEDVTV